MNKDFFIALGITALVYVGYSYFFPQNQHPIPQQETAAVEEQASSPAPKIKVKTSVKENAAQEEERFYTLSVKDADITFSSKGAAIKSFDYKDVVAPLNLTPYGREGYFATMPELNFKRVDDASADMVFEASVPGSLKVRKEYTFSRDGGLNQMSLKVKNLSDKNLEISDVFVNMGPGLATVKSEMSENSANLRAVCLIREEGKKKATVNSVTEKMMSKPAKLEAECGGWEWAGIDNRYFLTAFIPRTWKPEASDLKFTKQFIYNQPSFYGLFGEKAVMGPNLAVKLPMAVEAGGEISFDADFYIGPKDYNRLLELPFDLQRSIQFGFFGQFGKWARNLLEWLNGYTHNYGWAIIIMTVMIQAVMFPLTYKQLKSSAVMQKIQPEMKRIQEKYKNDPMTAQREMMSLYKKYGANPLSGCLPLFIQLPIFLALFNALRTSWALHGAPFIWWIQDLSAKDPYYVLPLAMGAMMFVQQKMTMPDIAKDNPSMAMMKWMPIFMTLIFLNFPAGLTLYWFVSNCISFVINLILKKRLAKAF